MGAPQGFTLITGASTGIGREPALVLASRGRSLVLVARSEDKLKELARTVSDGNGVRAEQLSTAKYLVISIFPCHFDKGHITCHPN